MSITLKPETQKLIADRLKWGDYLNADDLVQAALLALDEVEANGLDDKTLDAIDRAEDQIERGQVHDWKSVREEIRARFLGK